MTNEEFEQLIKPDNNWLENELAEDKE